MKSICITGANGPDLQQVAGVLHAAGLKPPKPAKLDSPVGIAFWHEQVLAAAIEEGDGLQAFGNLGRLWEQMAADIFVANIKSKVWGWADTRSTWLLDFWLNFEPRLNFVLVVTSPQHTLASAIAADAAFDSVDDTMAAWHAHHQELLRFYHRNPQRCLLVDAQDATDHPEALVQRCNALWKLDLAPSAQAPQGQTQPAQPSAISHYLAHQLSQGYPEAASLQHEIAATVSRLGSEPATPATATPTLNPLDMVGEYRALRLARDEQAQLAQEHLAELAMLETQCDQLSAENAKLIADCADSTRASAQLSLQHSALAKELQDTKQESELLLLQLHQVQEELETYFLKHQQVQSQLDSARATASAPGPAQDTSHFIANIADLTGAKDQLAQENNAEMAAKLEAIAQRDAATRHLKETQQESELLLLQLHQVQEELEHYFLQHQDAQRRVADADQRWARMLQRTPAYCDYDSLEIIGDEATTTTWRINNLTAAGRNLPQLDFKTVVENGVAGYTISRQAGRTGPLTRWPAAAAQQTELNLGLTGSVVQATQAIAALQDIATADWDLLQSLGKLLIAALDDNATAALSAPASFQPEALRTGLGNLAKIFEQFPPTLRFDAVSLKREQVNPDYEHLWLRLQNLAFGGKRWAEFEFRLSCANVRPQKFGNHPKLEFPEHIGQAPFTAWFDESFDDFGAKLELRFALPDAMDTTVWARLSNPDQAFLQALIERLPAILATLAAAGTKLRRPWADWTAMAGEVQRVLTLRTTAPEVAAPPLQPPHPAPVLALVPVNTPAATKPAVAVKTRRTK